MLLLAGCHAAAVPPPRWEEARQDLNKIWSARRAETHTCAMLAVVDYQGPPSDRSFTLELFYRAPGEYLLRGRGTLGVEGFRALVRNDSMVLLLERQKRGYAGPSDSLPDSTRLLWNLMREALPWILGTHDGLDAARCEYARPDRPARIEVTRDSTRLQLEYARYRDEYPYWHLRSASGTSPEASMSLSIRQQLYNPPLDSALFELELPAGTLPLLD